MAARARTARDYLRLFLDGVAMGSADVIPGVSGGTVALILGIYEELIGNLRRLSSAELWRALSRGRLREAVMLAGGPFLLALVAGIGTAVALFARLIRWLLAHQQMLVYSFFFGLILASAVLVGRRVRRWTPSLWAALGASALAAFWLVGLSPAQTPEAGWFVLLSGALAICAMILPGISGSFILVLLGKYEYVLGALAEGRWGVLLLFAVGAAAGLLSFARLLGWLLEHRRDLTLAVLTGFMLGSLRKVWPWGAEVPPAASGQAACTALALALLALGALLVTALERAGSRRAS